MFTVIGANPSLSAKALLFCVLTATRTTETIEARWTEIDIENQLWIIPKARMKKEREQRVPLSAQAVALLKTISRKGDSPWVFNGQSRTKKHALLSNMAMLNYLQETLKYPNFTVHGFRSSFRDWAAETTDHKREVIEQALAHQLADQAEAAYQRGDYMEKRKLLMNDWADYCFNVGAYALADEEAHS
jgi:integrase